MEHTKKKEVAAWSPAQIGRNERYLLLGERERWSQEGAGKRWRWVDGGAGKSAAVEMRLREMKMTVCILGGGVYGFIFFKKKLTKKSLHKFFKLK
jgi:hypothetical protein